MERYSTNQSFCRDTGEVFAPEKNIPYCTSADCADYNDKVKRIEFEIACVQLGEILQ